MKTVLFRTAILLPIVLAFSTHVWAAAPSKLAVPVINAVVTDVPGQIEVVGSNLTINSAVPTVKITYVDSGNNLQTPQLSVLTSSSMVVTAALPSGLRAGDYLVNIQTSGGTSNSYEFTVAAPAAPASIPASSVTVRTSAPASIDPSAVSIAPVVLDAYCDPGSVPTGGGLNRSGDLSTANISILESKPIAANGVYNGWEVTLENTAQVPNSTTTVSVTAYVNCLAVQ